MKSVWSIEHTKKWSGKGDRHFHGIKTKRSESHFKDYQVVYPLFLHWGHCSPVMLNVSPNITPVISGRAIHKDKSLTSLFSVLYSIPFHPPSLLPSLSPLLPFFIILHFSFISFLFFLVFLTPYIKYSK